MNTISRDTLGMFIRKMQYMKATKYPKLYGFTFHTRGLIAMDVFCHNHNSNLTPSESMVDILRVVPISERSPLYTDIYPNVVVYLTEDVNNICREFNLKGSWCTTPHDESWSIYFSPSIAVTPSHNKVVNYSGLQNVHDAGVKSTISQL